MVQIAANDDPKILAQRDEPRLWDLSAPQLHDAYWHARGVQCVCWGSKRSIQRAAELYLLIDPQQMVLFSLSELTARLTWHNALATRLRVVDESRDRYFEQVELDSNGWVHRIGRRYRPRHHGSTQIVLTRSRRLANLWMNATSRRDGWVRVRRAVPWSRVDHWHCNGTVLTAARTKDHRTLIDELVQRWPNPGQALTGIEELEPGIWGPVDQALVSDSVRIGPLWIGLHDDGRLNGNATKCLVGPTWLGDSAGNARIGSEATEYRLPIEVKPIAEVEEDQVNTNEEALPRSRRPAYLFCKRAIDILVSAVALLLLAPVMALIAVFIMLEDGRPILFGHRRQGRGGRLFTCWKFRTMIPDAERIARDLVEYNSCDGPQVYIQNDPRVTRVGALLRPAHLDELPQLWNVLMGQMSLVGPRPSPDDENQFCPAWRDIRLSVRPGITGLWQLNRRREPGEDFQEWIRYDIRYVRQAGLRMDLKILVKTAWVVVFGRDDSAVQ